jgi:hypothetical protein
MVRLGYVVRLLKLNRNLTLQPHCPKLIPLPPSQGAQIVCWHTLTFPNPFEIQTTTCRLRDLNDEINKLIREKGHWEKRIVELGGPDYSLTRQKVTDSEGNEIAGSGATGKGSGYRCVQLPLQLCHPARRTRF